MANKKISELQTRTPSLSDLILVGDPSNGFSYKCTVSALATIIETDIADGYVTLGTTQTISGAKTFSNNLALTSVANASTDTDKFLVLNGSNVVNYRTGSEVLSDIGGQGTITLTTTGTSGAATLVGNTLNIPNYAPDLSGYVPTSRTITINGTTQDLTANRTYNVGTVTSVAASGGTGISISGSPITSSGTITITNTAPDQIVALTAGTGISISGTYPNFTITNSSPSLGGTVTSVALSAPTGFAVTGSPITSSGTFALAFDTGYSLPTTASQTNWDTAYTNRITSLTTTGSSGAATLISNTLNIPNYTLAGLGGISLTSLSASAPLSYNNTTGAFSISQSNTTTDGYLSATDWNTFNSKIGGSGTSNYVPKFTATSTLGNSQIFDNGTNVGINTATPNEKLEVSGILRVSRTTSASVYLNVTAESGNIIFDARGSSDQIFHTQTLERLRIGLGGDITISTINNATIDTDKFLVSDSGVIKYRTGSEILSDIGGQGALTLTTTGTSGAATLVGNTLNIPQYSGGGGGSVSGTTNYIAKFTSSTAVGDSQIFDDGTNVGIGTATPIQKLEVSGSGNIAIRAVSSNNFPLFQLRDNRTPHEWNIENGRIAGALGFYYATGNATRMLITSGGNVGIQTTTIGSALQVNGNAAIGYSASTAAPTNGLAVAGSVGIGIAAAATNLHVYRTTAGLSGMQVSNLTHGSTVTDGMFVGVDDTQGYIYMYENLPIQLSTNSTVRLFINNDGTVFVGGTNAPASPTTGILSGSGATGTNVAGAELRIRGGASTGNAAGGPITFYTAPTGTSGTTANAATERMRINNAGALLVGTTSTPSSASIRVVAVGPTGSEGFIQFGNPSGGGGTIGSQLGGGIDIYTYTGAVGSETFTRRMLLNSSGNLGINTTTIGSMLQVNGNAAIGYSASTAAPTNGLLVSGNVGIGISPSYKLQVQGPVPVNEAISDIIMFTDNASNSGYLGIARSSATQNGVALSSDGKLVFRVGSTTEAMTIRSTGNVGIATATVGSRLQVNGGAAIGYSASTAAPTNGLIVAGNAYFGGQIASLTDVMQLKGSGNVLIAMQSTVNTQFSGMNLYNEAGTLAASFALGNSNTGSFSNNFFLGPRTASGNLLFVTGASGTTRMTMTTNGELQFTPAANTSVLSTTGAYSLTGANAQSLIDLAGTWNTTGNPTAIKLNITNTASGTGADLMELQVGGVNQFLVTKAGNISLGGSITTDTPTGGTKKAWKLGSVVVTGSWVIDSSRYVEVEIDGTAYKLALAIAP